MIFLQNYLTLKKNFKEFAYKNTKTEDLWRHWSASSGLDIAKMMKNFTTKEAFPLLSVSVESWSDSGEIELKISQSVFQVKGSKIDLKLKPLLWQIPISIKSSGSEAETRIGNHFRTQILNLN